MLNYYGLTDVGGRKNNEDFYDTLTLEHEPTSETLYLLIVADGLGGHSAGEVASKLAVIELIETVKKGLAAFEVSTMDSIKEILLNGFKKANEEICYQAKLSPEKRKMGTTLVAALLKDDGRGVVANLGDSRAYMIGDEITRITKDHSYVQELVDREIITEEEAFDHPEKNIVTKVIGVENAEPDLYEVSLFENILILCSDGLSDALKDEEIKKIVFNARDEGDNKNICENLVSAAKVEGRDNITVIVTSVKRL